MIIKYNLYIKNEAVISNLKKIANQIYKLLPYREEEKDWKKLLDTILEEISGMSELLVDQHETLFKVCCKVKGLESLEDLMEYRRHIFESITLLNKIISYYEDSCQE